MLSMERMMMTSTKIKFGLRANARAAGRFLGLLTVPDFGLTDFRAWQNRIREPAEIIGIPTNGCQ